MSVSVTPFSFALIAVFFISACGSSSSEEDPSTTPDPIDDASMPSDDDPCLQISLSFENGDAESVDPDTVDDTYPTPLVWQSTVGQISTIPYGQGGYPDLVDGSGERLLTGGNSAESIAEQFATIATEDAGCAFRLDADIGGFSSQQDNAAVTLSFLSASNEEISNVTLGPVTREDRENKTILLPQFAEGIIPESAVQARLTLTFMRLEGSANDGYIDNVSVSLP